MALPQPPSPTPRTDKDTLTRLSENFEQRMTALQNAVSTIGTRIDNVRTDLRNSLADVNTTVNTPDPEIARLQERVLSLEGAVQELKIAVQMSSSSIGDAIKEQSSSVASAATTVTTVADTLENLKLHLTMVISSIRAEQNQTIQDFAANLSNEMMTVRDRVEAIYGQGQELETKRGQLEASLLEKVEAFQPTPVLPEPVTPPTEAIVVSPVDPSPEV